MLQLGMLDDEKQPPPKGHGLHLKLYLHSQIAIDANIRVGLLGVRCFHLSQINIPSEISRCTENHANRDQATTERTDGVGLINY